MSVLLHSDDLRQLVARHSRHAGGVCWLDVEHWLWPVFTERWGRWREAVLGLSPVPLKAEAATQHPMPPPPPLLYTLSELLIPQPGYWPTSVRMTGVLTPHGTQVN